MSDSISSSPRCPTCKVESASVNARRNLAVFIDGTSNKPGDKETNVVKLFDLVSVERPDLEQSKYYLEGIGVYDRDKLSLLGRARTSVYSNLEMAFAWNVKKNVTNAYEWLVGKYREGDQIYLFGFSRGAYQVRALAGMIHEAGLLRELHRERIEQAYYRYRSIKPNDPQTRDAAVQFKKNFCWPGVRIHFVGVWDTVSSLGLIKEDVHVTSSASVTNACHFRHALALDERRVKFMPEYFLEMNAHRTKIKSPRKPVNDVKEIWFAGCHSDVGGTSRPHNEPVHAPIIVELPSNHAGNVPLQWMRREADAAGLAFNGGLFWNLEDVNLGRGEDTMNLMWKLLEYFPIRHQVSFSGSGDHGQRWHLSSPRLVIPGQPIHFSALCGDAYTPRATLACGVNVPVALQNMSPEIASVERWTSELVNQGITTWPDQQKTLESLWELFHILAFRPDRDQLVPSPSWPEESLLEQSGFNKFALTVFRDITSDFSTSLELVIQAKDFLKTILLDRNDQDLSKTLYILRFSAKLQQLRHRLIAHDEVIKPLISALDWIPESLRPLVMDSLRYLIDDDNQRQKVIDQFAAWLDGNEVEQTRRLLALLEVKAPAHLIASLRMLASLVRHRLGYREYLEPKISKLAGKERGLVGSAAIEALVALGVPLSQEVHISNVLGYLSTTLPRLDAEVEDALSPHDERALSPVLQVNGSGNLDEGIMHKLVRTVSLRDIHARTAATLILLKLCHHTTIQDFCSRNKVFDIFMKQLERRETSLLAAYALKTCLILGIRVSDDFDRIARLIFNMLDKGWFDDAVGRIEGFKILDKLMTFDNLRNKVIECGIIPILRKKLEDGERHEVRRSLICFEILGRVDSDVELTGIVTDSVKLLEDKHITIQKKGVKILSSLAQTEAGERAIHPHLRSIVQLLFPSNGSPPSRRQLFGPTAALYELCRNETLRMQILALREFQSFKNYRADPALQYP